MPPGRLPADFDGAGFDANRRRFSLSFAVCLVLGPAIFLAILAYEGSLADDPAPFDDDPSHHHRASTQEGLLGFCIYLDDMNHVQVKAGLCSENATHNIHHDHKIVVSKDLCIERMYNETFEVVDCSNSTSSQLAPRQVHFSDDLCIFKDHSGMWEPTGCDEREHFRIDVSNHISSDKPCYSAHPGGWWVPYSKPHATRQLRYNQVSTGNWCLHFGPDGKIETFECYLKVGQGDTEVVRCAKVTENPSNDLSIVHAPWNPDISSLIIPSEGTSTTAACDDPGLLHTNERITPLESEGRCLEVGPDKRTRVVDCLESSKGDAFIPDNIEPPPQRLLDRSTPPAHSDPHILADEPEKWINTDRCTRNFCDWVNITGEIRNRCYAKDDKNPNTPPMPDQALKYTAPFECNLCLELAVHHEDKKHIQRYCRHVVMKEDLVFKILMSIVGGILLTAVICGICVEYRRKKRPLKKPDLKSHSREVRFGRRSRRTPVIPPFDGMADPDISLFSITPSQKDAPEIHVISPTQSVISNERVQPEIRVTSPAVSVASRRQRDKGLGRVYACCTKEVITSDADAHNCNWPAAPSRRQMVIQPALTRSAGDT